MEINQAFTILQKAGGIRAARIIIENFKKISKIKVLWFAYQLKKGVPVAKIIHKKWFYGLPFYTNKYTLDPRPDTETLVSAVINDCITDKPLRILDLGTGTSCIIASLVKNIHNSTGVGLDKSYQAVLVARKNVKKLGLENKISIKRASFTLLKAVKEKFDIIVSNPPYIAKGDTNVDSGALRDPKIALFAKNEGFEAYQIIAKNAKSWLKKKGKIYLEIGINQSEKVRSIFIEQGWTFVRTEKDLAGIDRVLIFKLS